MLDGEFKVMGMAPYGDASKYDFSRLASFENGELVINTDYANVIGLRRYKEKGKGFYFSPKLIEWLGPKREGDIADEPYIHYAASMQALFEKLALQMIDHYLGDTLQETGKLAFAGGCALNVKLNQKIIARRTSRSCSCSRRPATPAPRSAPQPMCPTPVACRSRRWSTSTSARRTATKT
jgi:carbamoyltransferase